MRVALEVERTPDPKAHPRRVFLSRLLARVQFHTPRGWTDYHTAIVDTGAPYSLIPASLWASIRYAPLREVPMRGIVPGEAGEIVTTLANARVRLLDTTHTSPPLSLWVMLAKTDRVPLILGWAGCLDRARLVLDAPRHRAWLECWRRKAGDGRGQRRSGVEHHHGQAHHSDSDR